MKICVLTILFITSLLSYSQDSTITNSKKLYLGLTVSPDYSYRNASNNYYFTEETAKLGYTIGISSRLNITKKVSIESGLLLSNKGYKNNFSGLTFGDITDPRNGFGTAPQNLPSEIEFIYNYYYIDIPLKAVFTFGQRKIHFFAAAGITPNILIKATEKNITTYQNGDTDNDTQDAPFNYKKFNLSPIISIGVSRNTDKSILKIEPYYSYGLFKIIDAPSTAYLWSYGINVGYYIRIK